MRYDATAHAVEATGLVKRFGKTTALAGVDLVARPGRVLGVLGPNGAGKTTAVRILATLLRPDGGQANVFGYDVLRDAYQVRQLIGLTGQYASVDDGLSGTNNLIMIGRLLGLPRGQARARAAELLARFELTEAAGRIVKTYSGGMRRRLDLAARRSKLYARTVSSIRYRGLRFPSALWPEAMIDLSTRPDSAGRTCADGSSSSAQTCSAMASVAPAGKTASLRASTCSAGSSRSQLQSTTARRVWCLGSAVRLPRVSSANRSSSRSAS
jgi:ABC-type transport system involved in cytochrome c biogenesis ATPase subunit